MIHVKGRAQMSLSNANIVICIFSRIQRDLNQHHDSNKRRKVDTKPEAKALMKMEVKKGLLSRLALGTIRSCSVGKKR